MPKYRVIFEGEPEDTIYDSYEQAEEAALYSCSCSREGEEILHMSNPGDYDYDEYDENYEYEYEIEELEDSDNISTNYMDSSENFDNISPAYSEHTADSSEDSSDLATVVEGIAVIVVACGFLYKHAIKPAYKYIKKKVQEKKKQKENATSDGTDDIEKEEAVSNEENN